MGQSSTPFSHHQVNEHPLWGKHIRHWITVGRKPPLPCNSAAALFQRSATHWHTTHWHATRMGYGYGDILGLRPVYSDLLSSYRGRQRPGYLKSTGLSPLATPFKYGEDTGTDCHCPCGCDTTSREPLALSSYGSNSPTSYFPFCISLFYFIKPLEDSVKKKKKSQAQTSDNTTNCSPQDFKV